MRTTHEYRHCGGGARPHPTLDANKGSTPTGAYEHAVGPRDLESCIIVQSHMYEGWSESVMLQGALSESCDGVFTTVHCNVRPNYLLIIVWSESE